MKIYTKTGDKGQTSLLGGTRVEKFDERIEAYGTVDELNSFMGLLCDHIAFPEIGEIIREVQHHLFLIGSHLANDAEHSHFQLPALETGLIGKLEDSIDQMEKELPALKNFILPGGHPANSTAHIARCVCRRAERRVVELHRIHAQDESIIQFLNRLSDWLFVLSRLITLRTGSEEIIWKVR